MSPLHLPGRGLHVWWCESMDVPRSLLGVLTVEERHRCDRFRFEEDRRSYLAAHVMLRILLSRYGSRSFRDPFVISAEGKPSLPDGPRFSLSHTRGMVACAFAEEITVGVDVEGAGRAAHLEAIAERVMSRREVATLGALPEIKRGERLVELWTLKEAWAKARGFGLRADFRTLDTERPPSGLFLSSLEAPSGFRLAVAALGSPDEVDLRRFTMD